MVLLSPTVSSHSWSFSLAHTDPARETPPFTPLPVLLYLCFMSSLGPLQQSLLLGDTSFPPSTPLDTSPLSQSLQTNFILIWEATRYNRTWISEWSPLASMCPLGPLTLAESAQPQSLNLLPAERSLYGFSRCILSAKQGLTPRHLPPFQYYCFCVAQVVTRADSKFLMFSCTPCHAGNTRAKMVAFTLSFLASIFYYSPMRIISFETSIWGEKKSRSSFSDEILVQSWQTLSIAFATT